MKTRCDRWLALTLRLGLGALFAYAGLAKLGTQRGFTADVVRLQLVPFLWAEWLAAILSMAEVLTGIWLLSAWRVRAAALAAMFLASCFAIVVFQALIRGLDFDCHCFGLTTTSLAPGLVLARALLMVAVAGLIYRLGGDEPIGKAGLINASL